MRIIVPVKPVPDTAGERSLNLETGLAEREAGETVLDEVSERAIEAAVTLAAEHPDSEVVLLVIAPDAAQPVVRRGLAIGADRAVHVIDEQLLGADLGLTAEVLAAAIDDIGFDLVVTGNKSTDGNGGVLPAMIAELLDVPQLTELTEWEVSAETIRASRAAEYGTLTISAPLPAVASVTEAFPDARFPNFKQIRAAKTKPYETKSLAEVGVDALDPAAPRSIMIAVAERPPRTAGVKIADEGEAGVQLAEFLIQNRLA